MPKVTLAAIVLALSSLIGSMACQKQAAKSPRPDASAASESPKPFTLTLASGGGFSGLIQGYTLSSAGEVKAWRKFPGGPDSITWAKRTGPDSILVLAKALEAFEGIDLKEAGNMTTRIEYALPDTAYRWSISGAGPSPEAPEPFRTWYARAEAYCRGLAPAP
ncbi:MAG: hypothetical protein JWP91_612 [Fibrobacteres bacterium]|nr:hypothetical protein [Fibrobacterota bacterium]